jgi:hypothetical protein
MLANFSHEATTTPKRQVADWMQTKSNASRMPIRSSKELALINKIGKDAHYKNIKLHRRYENNML